VTSAFCQSSRFYCRDESFLSWMPETLPKRFSLSKPDEPHERRSEGGIALMAKGNQDMNEDRSGPDRDLERAIQGWESEGGSTSGDSLPSFSIQPQTTGSNFSVNRKAKVIEKPIYRALTAHQITETNWDYCPLSASLSEWFVLLNNHFRLGLPPVPLRLDSKIRNNCAGYFLAGHNEFGLAYEIAIRVPPPERLEHVDLGDLLGTLLHEQLHLLQELIGIAGANNYHNIEYRDTAERFGLLVDWRGRQRYSLDSPFLDLLAKHGVTPPYAVRRERAIKSGHLPPPPPAKPKPSVGSKHRKWSCPCGINVRVAVADFQARCLKCDGLFVRAD